MRTPCLRLVAILLAGSLVAAACADDPDAQALLDDILSDSIDDDVLPPPDIDEADQTDESSSEVQTTAPDPDPTPLPIDDDFRIGILDNGLTYLLRSNDTPGASLDMRLVVDAGSLQQPVGMDGSAHFLEHMLFNGTEAFPGNELTTQLQRLGIEFGADINAYTTFDETVYLLGATTFVDGAVDLAFDVLAEWASKATIDPAEVAAEIGVVRDELRQGTESVDGIVNTRFEEIYTQGTPYEDHLIIGNADLVEATTADTLRSFYDDYYRPDNMAIVVVGDLPLDDMEQEVVARFADLESRSAPAGTQERVVVELDPTPVVEVFTHPDNGSDFLSLDIPLPVWDSGTVGGERMAIIETAVALMLDSRLGEAFQRGDLDTDYAPFIGAFGINRGLRYYGTNLQAPQLDIGLEQFMGELLLAADAGFTENDVARMRETLLASLDIELATLGSTQDSEYADALTAYFLAGSSLDDAENRISRHREVIESLDVGELTNFWRWVLESSGPIIIEVGDDASDMPTADRLLEVLENVRPAGAGVAAQSIERLMDRPDPAATIDETSRATLEGDVEEWTFENGVVVSYLKTEITEGSFDVWLESTGGWSALDAPDAALARAATEVVLASGVGPHDPVTVERYLESRSVSVFAEIGEAEEALFGNAATSDAEDLFALIHLTMTQPRVDDVALRSVARLAETALETAETNPDLRLSIALTELLAGGDQRFDLLLDENDIASLNAATLLSIFEDRFGGVDDLHVAIVGDIEPREAFDLAARYLGTLPVGPDDSWVNLGIELPTNQATRDVVLSEGTANGGLIRVDWLIGQINASTEVTAVMLSTIINNRITETIREELGTSYGGFAGLTVERSGEPALVSYIQVDGDPTRLDEIGAALDTILVALSTEGPTADEFDRAFQVLESDYGFVNDILFLSTNLALTRFPDQDVLTPDDRFNVLRDVTRAGVRNLAAALYADPASIQISKVLP